MRFFGMDVHLEFCKIAVAEGGRVSRVGRIASAPEAIREFAAGLGGRDQVVLEATRRVRSRGSGGRATSAGRG